MIQIYIMLLLLCDMINNKTQLLLQLMTKGMLTDISY